MKKLLVLTLAALLLLTSCNVTFRNNVETKEGKNSSTTVELSIDKAMIESKGIDGVVIKSTLINDLDFPIATAEKTYSSDDFRGKTELSYNFRLIRFFVVQEESEKKLKNPNHSIARPSFLLHPSCA